ncbi:hypothetical protein [Aeromonas veronii]|uniref:hypothetical protein n=1 Tax=Aeromonas veronii TaxID=654 RepID=UPI0012DA9088|nr:hypothetical protein [Aeromonas veronii]
MSEKHPYASLDEPSAFHLEMEARRREERRSAALDEVRGLLLESGDPRAWLASMTAAGTDDSLTLLDALGDGDAEVARLQLERLRDRAGPAEEPLHAAGAKARLQAMKESNERHKEEIAAARKRRGFD